MTTSMRDINYAWPPEGHFWKWSAGYDAIEWTDGTTLALLPEVLTIIHHMGENEGIPPLGSLLLMLAACRDDDATHGPRFRDRLQALLSPAIVAKLVDRNRGGSAILPGHDPATFAGQILITADRTQLAQRGKNIADSIIQGLESIQSLPKDLRGSLSAKCHLASVLFHRNTYNLSRSDSRKLLGGLSGLSSFATIDARPRHNAEERLFIDLRALKPGIAHYRIGTLESILRTGLESTELQAPELPQIPVEPGDPRDLLDRLIASGGEGGAAAAVAKRAIAMMNFPGRFGTPRDLPVGGIADITNRGTIDRLLPGELAWDDLVLAARLVHNEALYFRREIPPMDVAVSHTVLLDRGLRLWGTGRVFSLGVALGLRHHPALQGPGETFEVAAATTDAFEYLDLTLPEGVRGALETLVPAASPEAFLVAWWDDARIVDDPSIPDLTFITAREHLEDDATRRLLGEIAAWIHGKDGRFRVIALTPGGELEMQAWSPGGNRLLCRGELDLDALLKPPAPAAGPAAPKPPPLRAKPDPLHEILPIYALDRLPFLFPLVPQANAFITIPDGSGGGIGVSVNRRLMQWPKPGWGAEELVAELPGRQHWVGRDEHGGTIVIASGETAGEAVHVFRWKNYRLQEIEVEASRHPFPRHAAVYGDAVILAYLDKVEALSLNTGRRVAEQAVKPLPAVPVLYFDGVTIHVEDSGMKPAFGRDEWSLTDTTWPRMFIPDRVSLEQGVLRVMVADKCLTFDPIKLIWSEASAGPLPFAPFEETSLSPLHGITLKRATWAGRMEIWLDPRGLLHVRDVGDAANSPWSILLSAPATSIWNPHRMLCSLEPRLIRPSHVELGDVVQSMVGQILESYLSATQETSTP